MRTDQSASIRVACVQLRSGKDRQINTAATIGLIEQAVHDGAQFVTTPEMTNVVNRSGRELLSTLPGEDGFDEIAAFASCAKQNDIWLLIGSMAVGLGDKAANRSFLFSPDGKIAARYDKIHMFDVDLPGGERWRESALYEAGNEAVMVNVPFAKIGLSICYDLRFPALYRQLSQAGATVLCVPAAFTKQTGRAHWHSLLRARAIENGAFVIAPAQGGLHEDGRETFGHSLIIDPWGKILAELDGDEPGFICTDIDLNGARAARQRIPNLALEENFKISIV